MGYLRKLGSEFILRILLLNSVNLSCDALYTLALWDFDSHDGYETAPQYSTDSNFVADLSPLGSDIDAILVPGRHNSTSVFVDGKSFNLATKLGITCLRDLDECESTWIIQCWLKIVKWNVGENNVIMRTTNPGRTDSGVYIGKATDDNILVYFRGSSGKTLWRTISQEPFMNSWASLYVSANDRKITILVSGIVQSGRATIETLEATPVTPANFVVGDDHGGPTFYLDDVRVRYPGVLVTSTSSTAPFTTVVSTTLSEEETTANPATESVTKTPTIRTTSIETKSPNVELSTSMLSSTTQEVTSASSATFGNGNDANGSFDNIWIPIVIGVLAFLVLALCLIWIILCSRRRKSGNSEMEHELTERKKSNQGYTRAPTTAPYHDEDSQIDTDGNNTDREESRSFVKK